MRPSGVAVQPCMGWALPETQATTRPSSSSAKVWPWLSSTSSTSSPSAARIGPSTGSSQVASVSLLTASATRAGPASTPISSRNSDSSKLLRRRYCSRRMPGTVGRHGRLRTSSGVPNSCSREEMRCETPEAEMPSWRAASSRLPVSTAAVKALLLRGSILITLVFLKYP
jgi:hypothetical protein